MFTVQIDDYPVRIDDQELTSLNDLWYASGHHPEHDPSAFMESEDVKTLIDIHERQYKSDPPLFRIGLPGINEGAWVNFMLVMDYGRTVSPVFEAKTCIAVDTGIKNQRERQHQNDMYFIKACRLYKEMWEWADK